MVRYYPRIENDNFGKICTKKEFKKYKTVRKKTNDVTNHANSLLLPHQQFMANYLNPTTPYKGMLIYHETGTGKTCTAVSVAENFKEYVVENNKKIMILSSDNVKYEFRKTIKSTETKFKCTGDEYINQIKNIDELTEDKIDSKLNELINKYYSFLTYQNFGNDLLKSLKNIKNVDLDKCRRFVENRYENIVLIVDEAHNLRSKQVSSKEKNILEEWFNKYIKDKPDDNNKNDDHKLSKDAIDIITYNAKNVRLLFLTATPMFDTPSEIIWLINILIRVNEDTIEELEEDKVFDAKHQFRNDEQKDLFKRAVRGKVSYLRSGDPLRFPLRIENENMFTTSTVSKEHYKKIEEISKIKDSFQTQITQLHNVSWHSSEQFSGLKQYFDIKLKTNPNIYEFRCKNKGTNVFDELEEVAPKIAQIVKFVEEMDDGIAFVFSKFVWSGIVPIMLALENIGYSQFKENSGTEKYLLKTRQIEKTEKKYAVITSTPNLSFERQQEKIIKAVRSNENAKGKNVRVILASSAGGEGIDLKNIRQLHILEPHYNYSLLEQVIGRAIRTDSHIDLEENYRNCTIFYHISKYENGQYGWEKNVYDIATQKRNGIQKVRKVLQENSISCEFFKSNNEFMLSHLKDKLIYDSFGKEIPYQPVGSDDEYKTNCIYCTNNDTIDEDSDTYHPLMHSKSQVFICMKLITDLFMISSAYLMDDLISIIQKRNNFFDIETILFSIHLVVNNRHHLITNKFGEKGMIYFDDPFLKFQPEHLIYSGRDDAYPLEFANSFIPLNEIPFDDRPNLDVSDNSKVNDLILKHLSNKNFSNDGFWDTLEMREIRDNLLSRCIIDKLSDKERFDLMVDFNNQPKYIKDALSKYDKKGGIIRVKNTFTEYKVTDKSGNNIPIVISKSKFPGSNELPLCGFINFEKENFIFKVLDRRTNKGTGANLGSAGDATKKKLLNVINTMVDVYCKFKNKTTFERYINEKESAPSLPTINAGNKKLAPPNNSIYIECEMYFRLLDDLKVEKKKWFFNSWETYEYGLPLSAK